MGSYYMYIDQAHPGQPYDGGRDTLAEADGVDAGKLFQQATRSRHHTLQEKARGLDNNSKTEATKNPLADSTH